MPPILFCLLRPKILESHLSLLSTILLRSIGKPWWLPSEYMCNSITFYHFYCYQSYLEYCNCQISLPVSTPVPLFYYQSSKYNDSIKKQDYTCQFFFSIASSLAQRKGWSSHNCLKAIQSLPSLIPRWPDLLLIYHQQHHHLTLPQSHWPPWSSSNMPVTFLPRGYWTCNIFCLKFSSLEISTNPLSYSDPFSNIFSVKPSLTTLCK